MIKCKIKKDLDIIYLIFLVFTKKRTNLFTFLNSINAKVFAYFTNNRYWRKHNKIFYYLTENKPYLNFLKKNIID